MSVSYGSVTVTTSPTVIMASNPARKGYGFINNSIVDLYFGPDSSITTSNAMFVTGTGNVTDSGDGDDFRGSIYGVVSTGTANVRYWWWD